LNNFEKWKSTYSVDDFANEQRYVCAIAPENCAIYEYCQKAFEKNETLQCDEIIQLWAKEENTCV